MTNTLVRARIPRTGYVLTLESIKPEDLERMLAFAHHRGFTEMLTVLRGCEVKVD